MNVFLPADILLPKTDRMQLWSVIACDQFTSDADYWTRVRKNVESAPSTLNLILPEAELGAPDEAERVRKINETMRSYLNEGLFSCFPSSYVYVERTLENGSIRRGIVGMVDLESYSFDKKSDSAIRATEATVVERIPPRMRVRRDAPLELPHILLLCDDEKRSLIEPLTDRKGEFQKLYDFDLMEGGGHISGWLVSGSEADAFDKRLAVYTAQSASRYPGLQGTPPIFVAGDGNHSLATAKSCYEELKRMHPGEDLSRHPARYALVELENIHDDALVFEPIHRIVTGIDPEALLNELVSDCCADDGYPIRWYADGKSGSLSLDRKRGELAVAVLQNFLDRYLSEHKGEIDYIHDDDALMALSARKSTVGFLLPAMEKSQLFRGVIAGGSLPRKTFSMGHAREKRYYLEARKIR